MQKTKTHHKIWESQVMNLPVIWVWNIPVMMVQIYSYMYSYVSASTPTNIQTCSGISHFVLSWLTSSLFVSHITSLLSLIARFQNKLLPKYYFYLSPHSLLTYFNLVDFHSTKPAHVKTVNDFMLPNPVSTYWSSSEKMGVQKVK